MPPRADTPLGADTPVGADSPPPRSRHPHAGADTPPEQTPPLPGETATAADSTHPTGVHSCYNVILFIDAQQCLIQSSSLLNVMPHLAIIASNEIV